MQLKTNASDLGNKNGEKNRTSDLSYFIKKNTLIMISHKFLKPFLMFTGSIEKTCGWKSKRLSEKVSQLLLHHTMVSLQNLIIFIIPQQLKVLKKIEKDKTKYFLLKEM